MSQELFENSRLIGPLLFPEPGGDSLRDLLDDLRADPVRLDRRPNQDRRARGSNGVPGAELPAGGHLDSHGGDGAGRDRLEAQSEGEGVHRSVLDGQGDRAGRPRAYCPRQGEPERPGTGVLRRDRGDDVRPVDSPHRPHRRHPHHPVGAETLDENHDARVATRGLEGTQTLDSRHLHHQRGSRPRGDREREEALRT